MAMKNRILVVEDHDDTREILRALLIHHGFEVDEVVTAEEMLERYDQLAPDLVILDVRLPGMDGCAALERLRTAGHDVPVFMFSENYDLFRDRITSCRPDGFFPKSKGPMDLVDAIRERLTPPATHN
jgi:CheY-like chemotaxis protein